MSIRVVVVDDQPLVRAGFRMILSSQPDIEVVGEAADGAQALRVVEQLRQRAPGRHRGDGHPHAGDGRRGGHA